MNIAVYACVPALKRQLEQYLQTRGDSGSVAAYTAAMDMICAVQNGWADAVVLGLSGDAKEALALAQQLRGISLRLEILFAADTAAHLPAVMALRASGCLLPGDPLEAVLDPVRSRLLVRRRWYMVHTQQGDWLTRHDEILYFRSDGHYVHVHRKAGLPELAHLGRMDDLQRALAHLGYVRCHQSYLVNPAAIRQYDDGCLWLTDGTRLPVSRRYAGAIGQRK